MYEEKKQNQKELIESLRTPIDVVKMEIITLCDEQLSKKPMLDIERFDVYIKSIEHPEGFKLALDVHPCLRIREGKIVRDYNHKPEAFFWQEEFYQKMKKKAKKNYFVGLENWQDLENYVYLRNKLTSPEDGKQLSFKVTSRKNPLEVFELPAEQRKGILVDEELAKALDYKILESYNDYDENDYAPVEVGDLLIVDTAPGQPGYYYRVDRKTAQDTYREGTI
jgi:hypothetical protein